MKVLVASSEKANARNGSSFLRLTLIDERKNLLPAVWFDPADTEVSGEVCEVEIRETDNPAHKPAITKLVVLKDADKTPFIRRSAVDPEHALQWFQSKTRNEDVITQIVDDIILGSEDKPSQRLVWVNQRFAEWPAAKGMHHAFAGGLLEHTYAMGIGAEHFLENDPAYQGLDKGIVYAAILLHDIGKILEYDWQAPGPASRTAAGILLGHIPLADEAIVKACVRLKLPTNQGRILHLRHCVLSHHGKKEWGSPVSHGTREAVLIHQLDMIQSRGEMAREAIGSLAPGNFVTVAGLDCALYRFEEEKQK